MILFSVPRVDYHQIPFSPTCLVLHALFSIPSTCLDYRYARFACEDPKNPVVRCNGVEFQWPDATEATEAGFHNCESSYKCLIQTEMLGY